MKLTTEFVLYDAETEEEIRYETALSDEEVFEIVRAIADGQPPAATTVIHDMMGRQNISVSDSWEDVIPDYAALFQEAYQLAMQEQNIPFLKKLASLSKEEVQQEQNLQESSRLYRIYASAGNPLDTATYLFVAEFARRKAAEKYADYIQKKKRYSDKAILIKEVAADEPAPEEGEIVLLLSPLGEHPVPKKGNDSEPEKPQPPHGHKKKKISKNKETLPV